MAYRVDPADFEKYLLSDNTVGVVDVHEDHLVRVAEILAEQHPGIILLWSWPTKDGTYSICAARPDGRKIPAKQEEKLVAAAGRIAANVANKRPTKRRGFFAAMFHKPIKPGWQFVEPTPKSK